MTRRNFVEATLATAGAPQVKHQKKIPEGEFDYVDWSWDRWHTITGDHRPSMTGEQSGKGELIDLAPKNQNNWPARRNAFVELLAPFLGTPPLAKPPLRWKCLASIRATASSGANYAINPSPANGFPPTSSSPINKWAAVLLSSARTRPSRQVRIVPRVWPTIPNSILPCDWRSAAMSR